MWDAGSEFYDGAKDWGECDTSHTPRYLPGDGGNGVEFVLAEILITW